MGNTSGRIWPGGGGVGVELVPWGLRFASVERGVSRVPKEGAYKNLDMPSTEGGTPWITQTKSGSVNELGV